MEAKEKRRTLFEIGDDLLALDDLLAEVGGEVTEQQAEAAVDLWLESLGGELEDKLDAYIALIAENDARAEMMAREVKRLEERKRVAQNAAARLRKRLHEFMVLQRKQKLKTRLHNLSLAANGGKRPLLITSDINVKALREEHPDLVHTILELNRDVIRERLEAGEEIPFARLGDRGVSLRIK